MSLKKILFPSLEDSSLLRYISFAALYVAQGIPHGLLYYALPAWLAAKGVSPAAIGSYVAVSLLPWSLKIIDAPIMDRFTFLVMGRRRPWILVGQAGLLVTFFFMSFIHEPENNLSLLMLFGFLVNFFAAFQDVATDGMAIDLLPVNQQARANGLMWGSKTLGISASVAAGSWAINNIGFENAIISFSFLIFLIMLIPLSLRERTGERLLPWSKGEASLKSKQLQLHSWKSIFKNLVRVFTLPVSLLMGVAAFSASMGRGLIDVILPVLTVQELGWSDTEYSTLFATANLTAGALGMVIGGFLIDYFGKIKMMSLFIISLTILVLIMSIFSSLWHFEIMVTAFISLFYILVVFFEISLFATAMQLCWKRISATQFTLYMTISNLGLAAGSAIFGPLKGFLSYDLVMLCFILFSSITILLLRFVTFDKHEIQIVKLDSIVSLEEARLVQNEIPLV
jgi:MFS transporter, PAT family, beta-lactamase induction signal transducer AmpG